MTARRRVPVTLAFCAATILLFVAERANIRLLDAPPQAWRALTPEAFNTARFWPLLLLSAMYHSGPAHLLSNSLAFLPLSLRAERRYGSWHTASFILITAPVASGAQMLVSGHGDIGSSGVVFGLVGWTVATGGLSWRRSRVVTGFVVALLLWFAYCFVANRAFNTTYGNASHTAGLLFGIAWGMARSSHIRERIRSVAA